MVKILNGEMLLSIANVTKYICHVLFPPFLMRMRGLVFKPGKIKEPCEGPVQCSMQYIARYKVVVGETQANEFSVYGVS